MRRLLAALAAAALAFAAPPIEDLLRQAGLRVAIDTARPRGSHEFRIHWRSAKGAAGTFTGEDLQFVARIDRNQPPPRQRSPEVSGDQLVVAVLDSQGVVRFWQIVTDPRLVRGEFPDAEGRLHNTTVYRPEADFTISVPDTVDAAEVRILSPGGEGPLKLSATAALRLPEAARR